MKTIINWFKVTSNKQKKTFTITTNGNKYLISGFTKAEFENLEYNTENDWKKYLKTQNYTNLPTNPLLHLIAELK